LAAHHITDLGDGNYRIEVGATDFNYFVQIGNKGTWSVAHVDVTAPEPVVEPEPHAGEALFVENFDSYADTLDHGQWGTVNLTAPSEGPAAGHWWAKADGNGGWLGVTAELVQGSAFEGSIASTSGKFWLDTQNSPGGIDITNWFEDPSGGDFQINFDIGTHKFGDGKMMETAHDASLNVLVDGQVVKTINYSDFANHDVMQHISFTVDSAAPDGAKAAHTISFVDTTTSEGNYVGFALDSIVVNDWLI
jgi:hypothetical protein